jgi:hypothetical protein
VGRTATAPSPVKPPHEVAPYPGGKANEVPERVAGLGSHSVTDTATVSPGAIRGARVFRWE